jgi:2-aminobenzoate-CoA ligase
MIKSSGYRIGPAEVEDTLIKHPAVADAGVIGVPDELLGSKTKAFIVLKEGYEPSEELKEEIINSCREHIAVFKLPRALDFVDSLPRTPTGKLLRRILREK